MYVEVYGKTEVWVKRLVKLPGKIEDYVKYNDDFTIMDDGLGAADPINRAYDLGKAVTEDRNGNIKLINAEISSLDDVEWQEYEDLYEDEEIEGNE